MSDTRPTPHCYHCGQPLLDREDWETCQMCEGPATMLILGSGDYAISVCDECSVQYLKYPVWVVVEQYD